jgi:hypothetical protein
MRQSELEFMYGTKGTAHLFPDAYELLQVSHKPIRQRNLHTIIQHHSNADEKYFDSFFA